jgi:UDPglucose 6-dehydrogenase
MAQNKLVGIVGYGYVGKAMAHLMSKKFNTIYYDPYVNGSCTKDELNKCELGVVCVMTAQDPGTGKCDVSILESVMEWLDTPLILIKSTVAPGTTNRLKAKHPLKHIMFSPEYIGEGDYDHGKHDFNKDMSKCPFVTIGGDRADTDAVLDFFVPILGPNKTYHQTDATTAEIAKYMENCYLATKVVFCYEFERICKAFDASYNAVRECWLLDPRMASAHSGVFSTNTEPYNGKCLPKDVRALIVAAEEKGYSAELLKEVERSNKRIAGLRRQTGI